MSFSEWLFYSKFTNPDDPVAKLQRAYRKDVDWPTGIEDEQQLVEHLSKTLKLEEAKYMARLAWGDYQQHKEKEHA